MPKFAGNTEHVEGGQKKEEPQKQEAMSDGGIIQMQ